MNFRAFAARFALAVSFCLLTTAPAQARFWQCAPYAREISGIDIHGNANTWWNQAAGKYERGNTPKEGAVLSFEASRRMRMGHVAMVSKVVSDREVLLTHANWSRRGGIERDVRAVDVSAAGDWSEVRVWFGPVGGLGTSSYSTNGFIYSGRAPQTETLGTVEIASGGNNLGKGITALVD
ncbi:CHAP domain-containing protein [Sphingomonas desiccabilis]|uniref:CHAP domain-containing protein n=1 Tax=Sphingomonas desiccabilis TaxID=429134 RepID=A0A4Q2IV86_9SPHN|nr:CHAP domain-containing protein [Sphingomonas desiccabilis]MBB3909781.1 surface antigen [Sphingomonas desiccabilis]RXZ34465.1 CHAP domain-containing protein [Sphingomonas desiccabilis]